MESEEEDGLKTKEINARILNPESEETRRLFSEFNEYLKKKYKDNERAYRSVLKGVDIEEARGSNFLFNSEFNNYFSDFRVASLEDLKQIYKQDGGFLEGFNFYLPEFVIRSNDHRFSGNEPVLQNLETLLSEYDYSPENPLRIKYPEIYSDSNGKNPYGVLVGLGENTGVFNDKGFSDGSYIKKFSLNGKEIDNYTKQDGISTILVGEGKYLDSGLNNSLNDFTKNSRIVIAE